MLKMYISTSSKCNEIREVTNVTKQRIRSICKQQGSDSIASGADTHVYEAAIKFCNIAEMAIEKNDIQKAHDNIKKVEAIIEEFQATLNHKYPVAKDFDKVYTYLMQRLVEANIKKDTKILDEVLEHLRTMRDAWKEVMRVTCNGSKVGMS